MDPRITPEMLIRGKMKFDSLIKAIKIAVLVILGKEFKIVLVLIDEHNDFAIASDFDDKDELLAVLQTAAKKVTDPEINDLSTDDHKGVKH